MDECKEDLLEQEDLTFEENPQETSAYKEEGCDHWTLTRMANEAAQESKCRSHSPLELSLINSSTTEICVLCDKEVKHVDSGDKLEVKGKGIDLLVPKGMENKEAKEKYSYFFTTDFLVRVVELYSEIEYTFPHPTNIHFVYCFHFKSPRTTSTTVTVTLKSSDINPVCVRRIAPQQISYQKHPAKFSVKILG